MNALVHISLRFRLGCEARLRYGWPRVFPSTGVPGPYRPEPVDSIGLCCRRFLGGCNTPKIFKWNIPKSIYSKFWANKFFLHFCILPCIVPMSVYCLDCVQMIRNPTHPSLNKRKTIKNIYKIKCMHAYAVTYAFESIFIKWVKCHPCHVSMIGSVWKHFLTHLTTHWTKENQKKIKT